jgi:hypothetical protein
MSRLRFPKIVSFALAVAITISATNSRMFGTYASNLLQGSGSKQPLKQSDGCGSLNPHMVAIAFSDQDPNQSFPPKTITNDTWLNVPLGPKTGLASDISEYGSNGGGAISMSTDSTCALFTNTDDSMTVKLDFETQTNAVSGHCCSGFGPGGAGTTNPEWYGQLDLGDRGDDWDVTVALDSTEVGPSPWCDIKLDGQDKKEPANTRVLEKYRLKGGHVLHVSCSEGQIGSRPGDWDHHVQFSEAMKIVVSAVRKSSEKDSRLIK